MTAADRLEAAAAALHIDLPSDRRDKLLAYAALILKWNKVYNLTAIRDEAQAIDLHLIDSLTVLPHIVVDRLADVGAGAGLPGLVLAIARPELQVDLVDTVDKKCVFMRQAAAQLRLGNVRVHHVRVESWALEQAFPAIISRAFASLTDFVTLTAHALAENGNWLAMKGHYPADELAQLPADVCLSEAIRLQHPSLPVERHLLVLARASTALLAAVPAP